MSLNSIYTLSALEVGQHFYWSIGNFQLHGQVLLVSWFVIGLILLLTFLGTRNLQPVPETTSQNLVEYILDYIRDLAKTQIGEEDYRPWIPYIGTLMLFIFCSNWSGALIPWKVIELPESELAAPTNDINTTAALALLTSISYFYAGIRKKGLGYFTRYIEELNS